jgi:NMD protein affecting ribosome stability and mRNA decay
MVFFYLTPELNFAIISNMEVEMCKACKMISEGIARPEQVENILEEISEKLSEEHMELVEEKLSDYFDTYDYHSDELLSEVYDDEMGYDEKQLLGHKNKIDLDSIDYDEDDFLFDEE